MNIHFLRTLPSIVSLTILTVALQTVDSTPAATLLLHYDVNDPASWNGTTLADLNGFGPALSPDDGAPRIDNIPPAVVPADFGAPVYAASGAVSPVAPPFFYQTPRNRAFLDFTRLGILTGSGTNRDQDIFNTGLAGNANVGGYTLEGFFLMETNYLVAENTGLGFGQDTGNENQLIRAPKGTDQTLFSTSSVDNTVGATQTPEPVDQNIDSIVPHDQWFHFVKVHDPVADQIRFYVNGILAAGLTQSLDPDSSALEYHPNGLQYGNVGDNGREIRDIGYSMTRFYRGALTDAEILANFREVAFVPEPGSSALFAIGIVVLAARRRGRLQCSRHRSA